MNFLTTVVGSFPRPDYLKKAFMGYLEGITPKSDLDSYITKSIIHIVEKQEKIDLDIITDGEQGRTSFVNFIGDKIGGIIPTHITKLDKNALSILKQYKTYIPYIRAVPTSYLSDNVDLTGDEVKRLKRFTNKPIKITLPSPYLLMWETWHHKKTSPYYNPEELGYKYSKIIRNEIIRLKNNGVNTIQLDEPMLGNLIEANGKPDRYRKIFSIINGQKYRGFQNELRVARDMINQTIKGISGIEMHICHWGNSNSPNYGSGVERLLPELLNINVDSLVIEYAAPGSGNPINLLKQYPDDLGISLGVIDVRDHKVENPQDIIEKIDNIINYVSPNKIKLCPDCGFSPGMTHLFPNDIAFKKLESMVKAAKILRDIY